MYSVQQNIQKNILIILQTLSNKLYLEKKNQHNSLLRATISLAIISSAD